MGMIKPMLIVALIALVSLPAWALPEICNCIGDTGPGGACYAGPGGPAYSGPGGPAYAGPGGPCDPNTAGPVFGGLGGLFGNSADQSAQDYPGGPAYSGLGGPCYAGIGGPCYRSFGSEPPNCPAVCR